MTPDMAGIVAARRASLPVDRCVAVALARGRRRPAQASAFSTSAMLTLPMNAHSGRPELAPYPDWTARLLIRQSPRATRVLSAHGELAGSWGVHTNADGSMPSIDERLGKCLAPTRAGEIPATCPPVPRAGGDLEHRAEPGDLARRRRLCGGAVSRDRQWVLRGRNSVLGQPASSARWGRRRPGTGRRGCSSATKFAVSDGAWATWVMSRRPARQPTSEGYLASKVSANRTCLDRTPAAMCPGPADAVSRPAAGRSQSSLSAVHLDLYWGTASRVGRRSRDGSWAGRDL